MLLQEEDEEEKKTWTKWKNDFGKIYFFAKFSAQLSFNVLFVVASLKVKIK